jgi:predicted RecB family nuclease
VVWNKAFEGSRNTRMGEIYPEYEEFCENMNERMFDLMEIFRDQLYIDPKIKGSYSIKQVLPLLVPDLKYDDLEIKEGSSAMINWYEMVYGTGDDVKDSLLKYCELDTLAMVRILEKVESIVRK